MPRTLPPDIKRDCWVGVRTYVPRAPAEWPGYHSTFLSEGKLYFTVPKTDRSIDRSIRKSLVNRNFYATRVGEKTRSFEMALWNEKLMGFFCLFVMTR